MPKHLPAGLTQYMLNNFSKKSPLYHVTQDDVSTPLQLLVEEKITGHQSVRCRGGVIAVMYETQWTGLSGPSWDREMDLQLFRHEILRYWAGTPNQHRQNQPPVSPYANYAAQRELSRNNGERFLAHGYGCAPRPEWLSRYSTTVLLSGAHVWYKGDDGLWWLGKINSSTTTKGYIWCAFWMTRDRSSFLFLRRATRLRRELCEVLGVCKCT